MIDSQKKHRRRIGTFVLLLVATPVLAALLILAWLTIRDVLAHSQLEAEIAELKAAGLPYDDASLAQYYAEATDDQNVEQWLEVLAIADSSEFAESSKGIGPWKDGVESRVPFASQPWPEEDETLQFLERWSDLRTEARQLALEGRLVRLPIEFHAVSTDLTLTQQVRQLARLFRLEAQVAIRNRDSAAARDSILALFGCARAAEGQPILISQLISMACENMAIDELRCAVQEDVLDAAALKAVQARIDKRPSLAASWKRAMSGEIAGMLPVFFDQRQYMPDMPFNVPWRSHDALTFVQAMRQAVAAPTDDLNEFYESMQAHDLAVSDRFKNANPIARFDTMLSAMSMPYISASAQAFVLRETLARLAMLGIGVRLYEKQHGSLPDRLEQLSQVGLDVSKLTPLGDKPFGYRQEPERAVLWGFHVNDQQSTPDEPPNVPDPSDTEASTDAQANMNRSWVWEFPTSE